MTINLRGVDLNLLVVLEALLDEAHVSRAAARLNLSQPATSSALDRCRALFGDPLLERSGSTMRLTPKAESLRAPLRDALVGVADVLGRDEPDIADVRRTVCVLMADLLGALAAPDLLRRIGERAPGIDVVLLPWSGGADGIEAAAKGTADLVVSVLPGTHDPTRFHVEDVRDERYVVAMRKGHPAATRFDLDEWLRWPHVVTSATSERHGPLDDALTGTGRERRVGLSVPSFLLVPELLRATDMVAMVPSLALASDFARDLVAFNPPVSVPGFTLKLAWHRRHERDPAVQFVAGALRRSVAELGDKTGTGGCGSETQPRHET